MVWRDIIDATYGDWQSLNIFTWNYMLWLLNSLSFSWCFRICWCTFFYTQFHCLVVLPVNGAHVVNILVRSFLFSMDIIGFLFKCRGVGSVVHGTLFRVSIFPTKVPVLYLALPKAILNFMSSWFSLSYLKHLTLVYGTLPNFKPLIAFWYS